MAADTLFTFDAEPVGSGRAVVRTNTRIAGAIAAVIAVGTGLVGSITGSGVPVRMLPWAAGGVVAAAVALAVTVKRGRLERGNSGAVRIALSSEGVTLTSAVQTTMVQWLGVRIEESRSDFVFYLPEGQAVRVRKAAINEPQGVQRLRSFLTGQAGTRARLLT